MSRPQPNSPLLALDIYAYRIRDGAPNDYPYGGDLEGVLGVHAGGRLMAIATSSGRHRRGRR
jgi:hypothetical protein